jgi:hypothetical protein
MNTHKQCPYCKKDDCIRFAPGMKRGWIYCSCRGEIYRTFYYLQQQHRMNTMITTIAKLKEAPFRIQGMRAHGYENSFEDNRAYETFEDAEEAAASQANNSTNKRKGNRFIIYKAIAVVGPAPVVEPPCETVRLCDI